MVPDEVDGEVLIVEDDQATARIVSTALDAVDPGISTHVVEDGRECLAVLRGEQQSTPKPDIVLLDLGLPHVDGITVLEARTDDPSMLHIPTIVLSGTNDRETILECYEKGVNTFISKPEDFDGYLAVADSVIDYWFTTAELGSKQQTET